MSRAPAERALAVTGIGLLTAAGEGLAPLSRALAAGRDALAPLPAPLARGLRHQRGGRFPAALVPPADPDRARIAAARAARAALEEAGLGPGPELPLLLGTGLGASERLEALGDPQADPAAYEAAWPARLARALAEELGLDPARARAFTVTCLSSFCALEQARAELVQGRAEAALVIGLETLSRTIQGGFSCLGALAEDGVLGLLLGEAACALVLERPERARARGARALALLGPQVMRVDGRHLTSPDPAAEGLGAAIDALTRADEQPQADGHEPALLLTAPASPGYAAQYARALGDRWGPAWSTHASTWEGVTGHCLGASTAVGVAFAAHGFGRGFAPQGALVLSVGFGGQSGATRLAPGDPAGAPA